MSTPTEPEASQTPTRLLPLRAFYFFSFGALGALFPYLPLLLAARGLDASQISWVMVLLPVSNLLVPPIWGGVADAIRARLPLLRLASFGCGLAVLLLLPEWGLAGSLIAVGVLSIFRAPLTSLADAATYNLMGGVNVDFSRVRVWGSVGFAVCVLSLGLMKGSLNPVVLLSATCAIYILSGLSLLPLRSPGDLSREREVLRQTVQVLRRVPILLYLLANTIYYAGHSTYDVYFGLHMKALGFDDSFVGTAWAVGVGVEIGVMLLAPAFLHRARSGLLLAFSASVAGLRWALLSIFVGRWSLLAIQPFHGVTFGLWYLSMVKYIQTRAPERLRTTLQAVSVACMGGGMVIGYLSGGQLFHQAGGGVLYRFSSCAAGAAMLLYLLSAGVRDKTRGCPGNSVDSSGLGR
jgi:hypothetical protein